MRFNWNEIMKDLELSFSRKDIEQIKLINDLLFQFMEIKKVMNK